MSTDLHSSKKGLTLIEVLLAVVILGVGAGTLMLATTRCLTVVGKSRHYNNARRLIQQVNTLEPLTRGEIEEGVTEGDFDDEGGYSWKREIKQVDEENRPGLYTVRTRVIWAARSRTAYEEMISYFYVKPEEDR